MPDKRAFVSIVEVAKAMRILAKNRNSTIACIAKLK
jgi:hypothetical protein